MRRIVVISTLSVVAVATAGLASAGGNGARKSGLASPSTSPGSCTAASSTGSQTSHGFAVLNAPDKPGSPATGRKIVGEVALKNAPAGTYDVRLATAADDCGTKVATLTVGSGGNGNAALTAPGGAGTYHVVLTQQVAPMFAFLPMTTVQKYASAPVTLR